MKKHESLQLKVDSLINSLINIKFEINELSRMDHINQNDIEKSDYISSDKIIPIEKYMR